MAKMNHTRPILMMIDDLKRQRARPRFPQVSKELLPRALKQHPLTVIHRTDLPGTINYAGIKARFEDLGSDIHQVACSVLAHLENHKDVSLVDRLMSAVSASMEPDLLKTWFAAFGPIEFVNGRAKYRQGATVMLDEAKTTPFWTL